MQNQGVVHFDPKTKIVETHISRLRAKVPAFDQFAMNGWQVMMLGLSLAAMQGTFWVANGEKRWKPNGGRPRSRSPDQSYGRAGGAMALHPEKCAEKK
jgi:hypothetical protein